MRGLLPCPNTVESACGWFKPLRDKRYHDVTTEGLCGKAYGKQDDSALVIPYAMICDYSL